MVKPMRILLVLHAQKRVKISKVMEDIVGIMKVFQNVGVQWVCLRMRMVFVKVHQIVVVPMMKVTPER